MSHLFKMDIKTEKCWSKKRALIWLLKEIDRIVETDFITMSNKYGVYLIAPYKYRHECTAYCHYNCDGYDCKCMMCIDEQKMVLPSDNFLGILRVLRSIGVIVEKIKYISAQNYSNYYMEESWRIYVRKYEPSQLKPCIRDVSMSVSRSLSTYVKDHWG